MKEKDFEREDLRVDFPQEYLKGMALWFCPKTNYLRLPLENLPQPDFRMPAGSGDALSIKDISSKGLMLRIDNPARTLAIDPETMGMFIYLQLHAPWNNDLSYLLSLFFYARIAVAKQTESRVSIGVEFLRQGIGARLEKTLELLNVEKYGVEDLMRWCTQFARQQLPQAARLCQGLSLDRLLDELDALNANPGQPQHCSSTVEF